MKVAFLTTSYPRFAKDNRGIFVYNLVKSLEQQHLTISVISPQCTAINTGGGIIPNIRSKPIKTALRLIPYSTYFCYKILRGAFRADIVHANWSYTAFLALLTKWIHHKPIILTERSSDLVSTNNRVLKLFLQYTYRHVDDLIALSTFSMKKLQKNFNLSRKISVIPNGVAINRYKKKESRTELQLKRTQKIILFVGRIVRIKGLDYLLTSIPTILKSDPQILFIFVGDGNERTLCEQYVLKQGLNSHVRFVGSVSHDRVLQYMSAADILVNPSLDETGGNVTLEALSSGLPVITTRVGWAHDIITDGFNGIIIKNRSSRDIIAKVKRTLQDSALRKRLGKNAKLTATSFRWEKTAKEYTQHYHSLLNVN